MKLASCPQVASPFANWSLSAPCAPATQTIASPAAKTTATQIPTTPPQQTSFSLRLLLQKSAPTAPAAVSKVLDEFAKTNDKLVIKTGAMGGIIMSEAQLKALAKLPSRDELLAILVATMNAPVQKFVRTLNEVPASFVRTLAAIRDAKEAA